MRYEYNEWLNNKEKKISSILNPDNPASWGKYLADGFKCYGAKQAAHCNEGITKINNVLLNVCKKLDNLKENRGELFMGNTIKLGMDEQDSYLKSCIEHLEELKVKCEMASTSMQQIYGKIKKASVGMSSMKSYEINRRKRENKNKSKKRKQERFNSRVKHVIETLQASVLVDDVLSGKE